MNMQIPHDLWRLSSHQELPITAAVHHHIESLIQKGTLKPGDRLPGQHNLARLIGISRTVLREALNGLMVRGLVTISQGRGVFISQLPPQTLKELVVFENITSEDLNEARLCVETTNARLAALRRTPAEMAKLWAGLTEAEGELNEEKWVDLDIQLHVLLAKATHNRVLVGFTRDIRDLLMKQSLRLAYLPGRMAVSNKEHRALLEAVQKCDPVKSEKMMRRHLSQVRKISRDVFRASRSSSVRKQKQ